MMRTVPAADERMALYTAAPAGQGPFPALVVIQHAPGVDTFMHAMADRLAEAGYWAAVPDLYHRQQPHGLDGLARMGQLKDAEVIADMRATVDYLKGEGAVAADRIGIIGFCMGGRVAYMGAATVPELKAAVCYYAGNTRKSWGEGPAPFERTAQIHCPILFHSGSEDQNPSPADAQALAAELKRHGKTHEFHLYPNAAHAFMNFAQPERYREEAAKASWPRTLDFLARYLKR